MMMTIKSTDVDIQFVDSLDGILFKYVPTASKSFQLFLRYRSNVLVLDPGSRLIPRMSSDSPGRITSLHHPHRLAENSLLDLYCTARLCTCCRR